MALIILVQITLVLILPAMVITRTIITLGIQPNQDMAVMAGHIAVILLIIITIKAIIITTVLSPKIIHRLVTGIKAAARLISIGITITTIKTGAAGKTATTSRSLEADL
jgi:hypothetical protein